jgi:hypothetical protein
MDLESNCSRMDQVSLTLDNSPWRTSECYRNPDHEHVQRSRFKLEKFQGSPLPKFGEFRLHRLKDQAGDLPFSFSRRSSHARFSASASCFVSKGRFREFVASFVQIRRALRIKVSDYYLLIFSRHVIPLHCTLMVPSFLERLLKELIGAPNA